MTMSDFPEPIDALDHDPADADVAVTDAAALVSRVSAAGFQVSQALEGLDQVSGLLRAAEELAKDADARRRAAVDEANLAEAQAEELGELLATARSDADDVDRRLRAAEERAKEADALRHTAENEAALARSRVEELDARLSTTRWDADEVERRVASAEERAAIAEDETTFARSQAKELGELLATARSDAEDVEQRVGAAEERATQAEDRLQQALERAFTLEAELEEANGRVPAAKTPRQITVIVDDQRDELRESVASEIRRPLTSIMGMALALKHTDPTSGDGKHMVRQLGASARRLERLVVQLLELDGIANGSYTPTKRRADLKAIVRRVVEETPDVDGLDVRVHAEHAAIELDPALTEQMVETLLANAARRSEPGEAVWVQVSGDHTGAVIAVDDTNDDVPAGLTGGSGKNGTGTGLALLSRLAELHGGRAWVEERQGGGASFRVFLPSGAEPAAAEASEAASFGQDAGADAFGDDHAKVVVDATSVAEPADELDAVVDEPEEEPAPARPNPFDALRELSSFDDLTDELAI